MSKSIQIIVECVLAALPYLVAPLGLLVATYVFKFIAANKQTRSYAKFIMHLVQGRLEESVGVEKSKKIMDAWNDIIVEIEEDEAKDIKDNKKPLKSKIFTQTYFLTRLRDETDLTAAETQQVKAVLNWMEEHQVRAMDGLDENYEVPKLPCKCLF